VVEGGGKGEARRAYEKALVVATEEYPALDQIDLWRYERARLLCEPEGGGQPTEADADKALELLERASGTTSATADKLRERVGAGILDRGFARVNELRATGNEAGVRSLAHERLLPVARKMVELASARKSPMLMRFTLDRADAMVEAGERGAGPEFKAIVAHESELPGGFVRVRLGWARALIVEGDPAKAFQHLLEVTKRLDAGEGSARPREFWFAWTLMLELLQEENKGGARSGAIRAHIKKLEAIDAGLGGEPWNGRIAKVRDVLEE